MIFNIVSKVSLRNSDGKIFISYIVDARCLSVNANNKLGSLSLLLAVALPVHLSGHNISLGVVQRLWQVRQNVWLVYPVFGSHGDACWCPGSRTVQWLVFYDS